MSQGRQPQPRSLRQAKVAEKTPYSLQREPGHTLEERVQALVAEMRTCLTEKRPVNLSNPPHREITEALHRLVYDGTGDPAELDVVYNDTPSDQKRDTFPVRSFSSLPPGLDWQGERAQSAMFNIGTLSFRHVSYDDYVDLYLMRDRETRTMSSLEIQKKAFERMTDILDDLALAEESYISIYQTGLEPLVVGTYCAVVHHLVKRLTTGLPPLSIRPVYFADRKGIAVGQTYWTSNVDLNEHSQATP